MDVNSVNSVGLLSNSKVLDEIVIYIGINALDARFKMAEEKRFTYRIRSISRSTHPKAQPEEGTGEIEELHLWLHYRGLR